MYCILQHQWDSAINFLENSLKEKLHLSESDLREQVGPGFYERWYKWTSLTEEQSKKAAILGKVIKYLFLYTANFNDLKER